MKKSKQKTSVAAKPKRSNRPRRGRKILPRARFLPALLIASFAAYLSLVPQVQSMHSSVLAYATNVSAAGLLSSTNSQRAANGVASLSANGLLGVAAQTKADDMVNRDYWSHVTPDGKQPWVFITNAGYQYSSAGENLAYGFMTSSDTVTGWMNSPTHKANLLSTNYTEVGFGIANSSDFVGDGQQTIVVAMYGKPLTAAAPVATKAKTSPATTPTTSPAASQPAPEESPADTAEPEAEIITTSAEPVADTEVVTATPVTVQRVQTLSNQLPGWSSLLVLLSAVSVVILWMIHKGFQFKHYFKVGEKFVFSHIHLDLTVLAIVFLASVLLSRSGVIR